MKKIVSRLLYLLFFCFSAVLIIACTLLVINTSKSKQESYKHIENIVISGGEEASDDDYKKIDGLTSVSSDNYEKIVSQDGYNALDTDEKKYLYEKIKENIYSITNEKDENGHYRTARVKVIGSKMSEFEIREVVNAFVYDNPQIFWFENLFGYAYSEDDTIVEFYSVLSSNDCSKYIVRFQNKIDEIMSSLNGEMSEYEREKKIYNTVLENCRYKSGVTDSDDGWTYFSAYGALVEGEAVCEGYAKSIQILLNLAGIPCSTVRGTGDGVAHIWNVVKLGGEWYHLDSTWDDNDDGTVDYEYFNVTTERIEMDHIIDEDINSVLTRNGHTEDVTIKYNFYVPKCDSLKLNYYTVEGCSLENFDEKSDKEIIDKIVQNIENNNNILPIRFGNKMSYAEYVDKMFYKSPHRFYYYVDSANKRLDDSHKIKKESVSVLKNESNMTIRIKLKLASEE